jgi:hypothetical protein
MMSKAVGKKAEPTAEELEFIYSCILRKLSDSEILEEMQGEAFPLRTKGFIKRRRKEFNAAKKMLEIQLKKEIDPVIVQRKQEHFGHMAEITDAIWPAGLDLAPSDEPNSAQYLLGGFNEPKQVSLEELSQMLNKNLEEALAKYSILDVDCLEEHLEAQWTLGEYKGLWALNKDYPYELIQTLRLLTRQKTFKGTCPVCKDWQ